MMLNHAGVNFTDCVLTNEEWDKMKGKKPFLPGGIPQWQEPDGTMFNESNALIRYIAKKHGYHPINPKNAWKADALIDMMLGDFIKPLSSANFSKKLT